jgi:hypothetical protein
MRHQCVQQLLAQLSQFEFFEDFQARIDARVNNSRHCESPSDNCADSGEKMIQRWPRLMIFDCNRIEVIAEPNGWNDSSSVAKTDITPVGIGVLVCNQFGSAEILVRRGDDFHDVFVRLQTRRVWTTSTAKGIERSDSFLADFLDLGTVTDLVDLMRKVITVGLYVHAVRRDVKVARHLFRGRKNILL